MGFVMVEVPMVGTPTGVGYPANLMSGVYAPDIDCSKSGAMNATSSGTPGFKYNSERVVFAAGQYREVKAMVDAKLIGCGPRFHSEPADLPAGVQLDPSTGTIWGTPLPPPRGQDAAGPYRAYTIFLTSPAGVVSTRIGLKVVNFDPQGFKITNVSALAENKYLVLVDAMTANR